MSKIFRSVASIAGILALIPVATLADGPQFSGFVTATYLYDLNDPASGQVNNALGGSNFYGGKNASFKADAAHLTITGGDSAGATYRIDLDAGTNSVATGGSISIGTGWAFDVQQAFVSIPLGTTPLGLQAGKFYTPVGIEVGNSGADPTITRGLAFGILECTAHTGALLTFKVNDQISGAIGGVNGTDVWLADTVDGIPVGHAKVSFNYGDPIVATVAGYFGHQNGSRENFLSLDLTGVNKSLVPSLDLNFQVNFKKASKAGVAGKDATGFLVGLQPLYHMGAAQVGVRYEFLSADDGSTTTTINSIALAPGYKVTQSTLLRAEYRIDLASEKVFEDDKGAGTKTAQLVGAELNYTF
ncbi:MAG TPA: outer membrane beta-barrel protein [Fibrobacteria bacterium]|nr:outer membrane beta-barrel protein [Fibrobacteria bacterium]